jgi:anthranilate phosphoribosyltransferase
MSIATAIDPRAHMRSVIGRIATGPEYSKDISADEARDAMRIILNNQADPVQAGIFFIALRMKRETDDENIGVLDAITEVTETVSATTDEVAILADPYDGYSRSLTAAPFLPAVLAACGLPTVSTGVEDMGPKHGATHKKVLRAAGIDVDVTPADAAARMSGAGWAYCDQSRFAPQLHGLTSLRSTIVKRPVLTTVEVLLTPVRGAKRTHFITGYVHKPYPRVYALLARHAGFDDALIIRGTEGGVIPSLRQDSRMYVGTNGRIRTASNRHRAGGARAPHSGKRRGQRARISCGGV